MNIAVQPAGGAPQAATAPARPSSPSPDQPRAPATARGAERGDEPRPRAPWQLTGLFIIAALVLAAYARVFLVPVILAFLLALVFSPVRRWGERRGIPASLSAALVLFGLMAGIVVAVAALATPLADWAQRAPEIGREVEAKLRDLIAAAQTVMDAGAQIDAVTGADDAVAVVVQGPGMVTDIALGAPMIAAQTVTVLVLLFFILASGDMFYEKLVHVLPTFRDKITAMRIARDVERKLSRYLFTITAINAGLGAAVAVGMWAVGMPSPLLFGLAAFALNFVPFVGALAGTLIALAVGLVSYAEPAWAFLAAALYFGLTSLEGQIVTPHFVGRSLKLNTVVIFLSVALWAWLWSIMGMLMAVPLLVTMRVFSEHVPALHAFGDFLSARGSERPQDASEAQEAAGTNA